MKDLRERLPLSMATVLLLFLMCEPITIAAFQPYPTNRHSPPHETSRNRQQNTKYFKELHGYVKLDMAIRNRGGLEQRREGATPTEGGMTLYVKAGPDGKSLGDCPFAQFVRMVLECKGLEYDLVPSIQETKPTWLVDYYDGKMPALRHKKECYVDSDTIAAYLDFFFPTPTLTPPAIEQETVDRATEGLFPAMAGYLKHTPLDSDDDAKREALGAVLQKMNTHLDDADGSRNGPFLCGDGKTLRLPDLKLAPILFHLCTGVQAFKDGAIDLDKDYPNVASYRKTIFEHEAFQATVYPEEVVTWGWSNARS